MNKIIHCGKVDFNKTGRKVNAVELELRLDGTSKGPRFSASGAIWNSRRTNCETAGQCLDAIFEFPEMKPYAEIYELWKKYHLNDMHSGTERQEKILDDYVKEHPNWRFDYDEALEILKKKRALTDNGYKYGSKWLYKAIPDEDLAKIRKWMGEN